MSWTTTAIFLAITGISSGSQAQLASDYSSQSKFIDDDTQESRAAFPSYAPSLGTFPSEQGWSEFNFDGDDEIIDQVFHLNATGSVASAQIDSVGFDWSLGFEYSMTARVPVGTVAVTFLGPGYRGGATLVARDAVGYQYAVLVGADRLVFSSQSNFSPNPILTISTPFDGASDFHIYTIKTDANGATLHIDGTPLLHVPPGDIQSAGSPYIQWSIDGRAHAVQSEWADVTFTPTVDPSCTADINGDGVLDFFDVSAFINAFQEGCP